MEDVSPFLRSYVRLLLAFRSELSSVEIDALLDRQRQLADNRPVADSFPELRIALREKLDRHLSRNEHGSREEALNRLLFSVFLDSTESDFFYLVEPMFEFARIRMSPLICSKIYWRQNFQSSRFRTADERKKRDQRCRWTGIGGGLPELIIDPKNVKLNDSSVLKP